MKPSEIPFQEGEIRIVYGIDESGKQVVATTYTAKGVEDSIPDLFSGITMLELAKLDFLGRHGILDLSHMQSE